MIIPCLRRSAVAALFTLPLLSAAHATGQSAAFDPPSGTGEAATPPVPVQPKLMRAAERALLEVQEVLESGPHLGRNIERLAEYQFSPQTARLLEETIGSARPMRIERLGKRDGHDAYRLVLPAREHTLEDGVRIGWSESPSEVRVDKTGRRLTSRGTWAALDVRGKEMGVAVRDMTTATDQRLGKDRLWFGTVQVDVARLDLQLPRPVEAGQAAQPAEPVRLAMDGLSFSSRTTERAATMDVVQRMRIAGIGVAGERVSNLIMNYRVNNIDKQNMAELTAREREIKAMDKERDAGDLLAMLRAMARASSKAGTALTIERISADYGGHTFTLQGRVALKGAQERDFDDLAQLFKRIDARFDIAVPVALVKAGALAAARRQLAAAGNAGQDPAAMAQTMTDVVVGKLLGEGFARLDKGVLRATITARGGQLRVNGKEVSLPKPSQPQPSQPQPSPQALPTSGRGGAHAMPARQVSGSCTMPEYPSPVIAQDAPLMLALRVRVDQAGMPGEVAIASPSAYPDFDRQVVAAQAACRYLPALRGDTPVAMTVPVVIRREAGTTRP